jgi:hypothetical protein
LECKKDPLDGLKCKKTKTESQLKIFQSKDSKTCSSGIAKYQGKQYQIGNLSRVIDVLSWFLGCQTLIKFEPF